MVLKLTFKCITFQATGKSVPDVLKEGDERKVFFTLKKQLRSGFNFYI